jgi:hypothetical protein
MSESKTPWHYYLLWFVAILALVVGVLILVALLSFRAQARQEIKDASTYLETVELGQFDLPIVVDETLMLSMTVPFSDTFFVPISATIPVSTSILFEDQIVVPINTNIPINTTFNVPVDIPLVGLIDLPIPISTNIPVNLTVDVPISSKVPINIDIPVNLLVDVPVASDIPIETDIPIQLEFPVTIPLDEMGFQTLLTQLQEALQLLAQSLGAK